MNACELTATISALAIIIADNTPNNDELIALGLSFTQLGYTLNTIVAQRRLLNIQP